MMRVCTKCGVGKPDDSFALIRNGRARYATCKQCKSALKRQWVIKNPDKVRAYKAKYDAANNERKRACNRRYYEKNREVMIGKSTLYVRANRDKVRPYQSAYQAARRRHVDIATPKWADPREIVAVYRYAAYLSNRDGTQRHVDHVIPIAGRRVCGLHVANNLQILTGKENRQKFNRHESERL